MQGCCDIPAISLYLHAHRFNQCLNLNPIASMPPTDSARVCPQNGVNKNEIRGNDRAHRREFRIRYRPLAGWFLPFIVSRRQFLPVMAGHFIYIRGAPRDTPEFHEWIKRQIAPLAAKFTDFIAVCCDEVVSFPSSSSSDLGIIIEKIRCDYAISSLTLSTLIRNARARFISRLFILDSSVGITNVHNLFRQAIGFLLLTFA